MELTARSSGRDESEEPLDGEVLPRGGQSGQGRRGLQERTADAAYEMKSATARIDDAEAKSARLPKVLGKALHLSMRRACEATHGTLADRIAPGCTFVELHHFDISVAEAFRSHGYKVMTFLRDPVQRMISEANKAVEEGLEDGATAVCGAERRAGSCRPAGRAAPARGRARVPSRP